MWGSRRSARERRRRRSFAEVLESMGRRLSGAWSPGRVSSDGVSVSGAASSSSASSSNADAFPSNTETGGRGSGGGRFETHSSTSSSSAAAAASSSSTTYSYSSSGGGGGGGIDVEQGFTLDKGEREKERDRRRLCAQRATQCKKEGNDLFRRKKRRAACERYTDAITAFPHEVYNGSDSHLSQKDRAFVNGNIDITHLSIYYSNRAMAKLHLREYKGVLADSIAALRLNKHNPKASYFLGLLYLHCFCSPDGLRLLDAHDPDPLICAPTRKSLSMAVAALTAAEEGARREGRSRAMIYEYRKIRLMARKHEWILKQLKEQQKLLSLQAQCIAVLGNLKASGGSPRPDVADLHAGQSDDGDVGVHNGVDEGKGGSTASASGSTGTITPTSAGGYSTGCRGVDFDGRSTASGRSCDDRGLGHQGRGDDEEHRIRSIEREKGVLGVIEEALEDVAIHCHDRPVPDFLCCKITFEPMLDPVMTPSGHSFERAVLERYIAQNPVDPISRKPLYLTHLVPNLNLREAVEEFLMEQPWSYDHGSRLEDTIDPEYMARHSSQQGVGGSEAGTQRKAHFSTTVLREELIRLGIVKGLPHQGVKGKG